VDAEQVRAAVTVALDAAMEAMVDEIARRVVAALNTTKNAAPVPPPAPAIVDAPMPATPVQAFPRTDAIRRVTPMRIRSGSILGLSLNRPEPDEPSSSPQPPTHSRSGEPNP